MSISPIDTFIYRTIENISNLNVSDRKKRYYHRFFKNRKYLMNHTLLKLSLKYPELGIPKGNGLKIKSGKLIDRIDPITLSHCITNDHINIIIIPVFTEHYRMKHMTILIINKKSGQIVHFDPMKQISKSRNRSRTIELITTYVENNIDRDMSYPIEDSFDNWQSIQYIQSKLYDNLSDKYCTMWCIFFVEAYVNCIDSSNVYTMNELNNGLIDQLGNRKLDFTHFIDRFILHCN